MPNGRKEVNAMSEKLTLLENGQKVDEDGFKTSSQSVKWPFCVAVKIENGQVMVRNTNDPSKNTLSFSKKEWQVFVSGVKLNEFDT
jgi:hypothetical protein